jgi:hypothetical protein
MLAAFGSAMFVYVALSVIKGMGLIGCEMEKSGEGRYENLFLKARWLNVTTRESLLT